MIGWQEHHIITKQTFKLLVPQTLFDLGLIDRDAGYNLLMLPTDASVAASLNVSKHLGPTLGTYQRGQDIFMTVLERTNDFQNILNDPAALGRILSDYIMYTNRSENALLNGELHASPNKLTDPSGIILNQKNVDFNNWAIGKKISNFTQVDPLEALPGFTQAPQFTNLPGFMAMPTGLQTYSTPFAQSLPALPGFTGTPFAQPVPETFPEAPAGGATVLAQSSNTLNGSAYGWMPNFRMPNWEDFKFAAAIVGGGAAAFYLLLNPDEAVAAGMAGVALWKTAGAADASEASNYGTSSFGNPLVALSGGYQQPATGVDSSGVPQLQYDSSGPQMPYTLGVNETGIHYANTAMDTANMPFLATFDNPTKFAAETNSAFPIGSMFLQMTPIVDSSPLSGSSGYTLDGVTLPDSTASYFGGTDWVPTPTFGSDFGSSGIGDLGFAPIILDLYGDGIGITPVTGSNQYFDMAGTGYKQRTAWAGQGDAVLAFDADGDGKITERNEVVFTDWDPTSKTDMEALARVFDTNHNGKLDAGDEKFASFKLVITYSDGTTPTKTLAQAGITEIDLTADKTQRVMEDGSSIDGQTTFTRSDGTTGTAATVSLAASAGAGVVKSTVSSVSGVVTIDNRVLDTGGRLVSESTLVTSADRKTRTLSFDDDGVVDRVRTTVVDHPTKPQVETVTDRVNGILTSQVTTTKSADGATVTILRDTDGDGKSDQKEVDATASDGSSSVTIQNLNEDASVINTVLRTVSADGLTATTKTDLDNANGYDLTSTDATVVAGDKSRTRTVTETTNNGSLRDKTVTVTSADGTTRTENIDSDGDGTVELVRVSSTTVRASDGTILMSVTEKNGDGTTRDIHKTEVSASGLNRAESWNVNGDSLPDAIHRESNSIDASGNRTLVTTELTGGGTILSRTTTVKGADGITRTTSVVSDYNGKADSVDQVAVASGVVTETLSNYRPDGTTLINKTITTTSADGLTKTIRYDRDGNSTLDLKTVVQTVNNDGNATVTTTDSAGNGKLIDQSVVTTSANGLTTTTKVNLDGGTGFDLTTTSVTAVGTNGVRTTTETATSADGTLQSKRVTTLSADRNVTTITTDANGDGATESIETITKGANGSVTDVVSRYARNGTRYLITTSKTDDTGLTQTVDTNIDASGADDQHDSDTTQLFADGRRIETIKSTNADGTLRNSQQIEVSSNGLSTTVQTDVNGDSKFDGTTVSGTVLNPDGSRTTTVTRSAGGSSAKSKVVSSTVTTVSDDGLSTTVVSDFDGNSLVAASTDVTTTDVKTLNADGKGGTSETVTHLNNKGALIDKVTTAISANRKATTITSDLDGNGKPDRIETINVQTNGDVIDTTTAYDAAGTVIQTVSVTTSADGLSTTRTLNVGNDSAIDETQTRTVVYNTDGSTTVTVADTNTGANIQPGSYGDNSRIVTTTSADGLHKTITVTGNNEGFGLDHVTTDDTVLGADGSKVETRTVTTTDGNGASVKVSQQVITDTAHGLKHTVQLDEFGTGVFNVTDETVVNADGSTTRTYIDNENGALYEKEVTTTSANGRYVRINHDTDGDGNFDEYKTTNISADRTRTDTIWTTTNAGTLLSRTVQTTSADGRTQTITFDTDGDTVVDAKQTQVSVVNYDGSTTQTRSDTSGKDVLRDRVTTTTSANGYRITGTIDLDGDGTTDETFSNRIVLNTDGSKTQTIQTKYADGSTKNTTVIQTSANGQHTVTSEDLNGDGRNDVVKTDDIASSGVRTIGVRYYDASGKLVSSDTTTTSTDGRLSSISRDFDGNGTQDALELASHVADGNGSYDIAAQDAASQGILFEANHSRDENGVDQIWTSQLNQNRQTYYDPAVQAVSWVQTTRQQSSDQDLVARIYDVVLDRDPTSTEKETYLVYAGTNDLVNTIMASTEFRQRYGTLSNAQFVEQMYENAYGRSAKASELNGWLTQFNAGTAGRMDVIAALTVSGEHLTVGNVHTVTSSSQNVSGKFSREHTTDKMVASDIVDRIYSTGLARHETSTGAGSDASQILAGTQTEAGLAAKVVASSEFASRYGSLGDGQFVTQMFQNALGRAPTSTELSSWTGLLGARAVSRGDLVVGLADDLDYKGVATTSSTSSTTASAATPSSVNARQASSFNKMVQAMSTMSEHPHAAWASSFAATQTSQEHQLAAAHH